MDVNEISAENNEISEKIEKTIYDIANDEYQKIISQCNMQMGDLSYYQLILYFISYYNFKKTSTINTSIYMHYFKKEFDIIDNICNIANILEKNKEDDFLKSFFNDRISYTVDDYNYENNINIRLLQQNTDNTIGFQKIFKMIYNATEYISKIYYTKYFKRENRDPKIMLTHLNKKSSIFMELFTEILNFDKNIYGKLDHPSTKIDKNTESLITIDNIFKEKIIKNAKAFNDKLFNKILTTEDLETMI